MDIAKLISEMTNEQAYQLMQKAELHAKTLSEPCLVPTGGTLGKGCGKWHRGWYKPGAPC